MSDNKSPSAVNQLIQTATTSAVSGVVSSLAVAAVREILNGILRSRLFHGKEYDRSEVRSFNVFRSWYRDTFGVSPDSVPDCFLTLNPASKPGEEQPKYDAPEGDYNRTAWNAHVLPHHPLRLMAENVMNQITLAANTRMKSWFGATAHKNYIHYRNDPVNLVLLEIRRHVCDLAIMDLKANADKLYNRLLALIKYIQLFFTNNSSPELLTDSDKNIFRLIYNVVNKIVKPALREHLADTSLLETVTSLFHKTQHTVEHALKFVHAAFTPAKSNVIFDVADLRAHPSGSGSAGTLSGHTGALSVVERILREVAISPEYDELSPLTAGLAPAVHTVPSQRAAHLSNPFVMSDSKSSFSPAHTAKDGVVFVVPVSLQIELFDRVPIEKQPEMSDPEVLFSSIKGDKGMVKCMSRCGGERYELVTDRRFVMLWASHLLFACGDDRLMVCICGHLLTVMTFGCVVARARKLIDVGKLLLFQPSATFQNKRPIEVLFGSALESFNRLKIEIDRLNEKVDSIGASIDPAKADDEFKDWLGCQLERGQWYASTVEDITECCRLIAIVQTEVTSSTFEQKQREAQEARTALEDHVCRYFGISLPVRKPSISISTSTGTGISVGQAAAGSDNRRPKAGDSESESSVGEIRGSYHSGSMALNIQASDKPKKFNPLKVSSLDDRSKNCSNCRNAFKRGTFKRVVGRHHCHYCRRSICDGCGKFLKVQDHQDWVCVEHEAFVSFSPALIAALTTPPIPTPPKTNPSGVTTRTPSGSIGSIGTGSGGSGGSDGSGGSGGNHSGSLFNLRGPKGPAVEMRDVKSTAVVSAPIAVGTNAPPRTQTGFNPPPPINAFGGVSALQPSGQPVPAQFSGSQPPQSPPPSQPPPAVYPPAQSLSAPLLASEVKAQMTPASSGVDMKMPASVNSVSIIIESAAKPAVAHSEVPVFIAVPQRANDIHTFRICVIGGCNHGKTGLCTALVSNRFDPVVPTVGSAGYEKMFSILSAAGAKVKLSINDCSGLDRSHPSSVPNNLLRESDAFILVCGCGTDIDDSLQQLKVWHSRITTDGEAVTQGKLVVVVCAKTDLLPETPKVLSDVQKFSDAHNYPCYITSAKANPTQVRLPFYYVADTLYGRWVQANKPNRQCSLTTIDFENPKPKSWCFLCS